MTDAPSPAPGVLGRTRAFAPALLIGVAAFTIALAGARSIGDIIGPVFLALVLTVTLHPIRLWLERTRLPGWAVSVLMLLAAYLVIVPAHPRAHRLRRPAGRPAPAVRRPDARRRRERSATRCAASGSSRSRSTPWSKASRPRAARRLRGVAAVRHAGRADRPVLPVHRAAVHGLRHRLHPPQPGHRWASASPIPWPRWATSPRAPAATWASRRASGSSSRSSTASPCRSWASRARSCGPCSPSSPTSSPTSASSSE